MIFITGDRSLHPVGAVMLAADVITAVQREYPGITLEDIATGDLGGVEAAVRYLLPQVTVVASKERTDGSGKTDLDERHKRVKFLSKMGSEASGVSVWFVHPDPLDSRVFKSLCNIFEDDEVRVVTF